MQRKTSGADWNKLQDYLKVPFDKPRIIIIEVGMNKKYVLPGDATNFTKSSIQAFISAFLSRKASQYELGIKDEYKDGGQSIDNKPKPTEPKPSTDKTAEPSAPQPTQAKAKPVQAEK